MTKTIFRTIISLGILVLVLCTVLFFALQYTQTLDETYAALEQETAYAANGLALAGTGYLKALDKTNHITWIDADGEVLYDNELSLPVSNQLDCPEVADALARGEGRETRKAFGIGESTLNYALRLSDGTVLRLSRPVRALQYALLTVSPVLLVLVLVLLISGIMAFRGARQIVGPINALDLEHPDNAAYPELAPLLNKIREQKQIIQEESFSREQMRREFTANVSHELKTPLTAISGFAELMANGVVSADKVEEFSSDIYKETQRLIALINDILRLSQLDENDVSLQKEPVDLYELSAETVETLRSVAEKNTVSIEVQGYPARITGVRSILYEMIYNLCDNAVKYNHPGGSVCIQAGRQEDGGAFLRVSDTGIGIPKEHQHRVFERFYRVDKSHSRAIGGTGLGLSIVKHGAIYHNAEIEMDSTEGAGTVITVRFPAQDTLS